MTIAFQTLKIPQGDGSILIRPGKPVELPDYISTAQAAEILGLATTTITHLCDQGAFPGTIRSTHRRKSRYRIPRAAVLKYHHSDI